MTASEAITEHAPAKLNLALHVTGQRADGYHLLDSIVAFAGVGDRVTVAPADHLSLTITGPHGASLEPDDDNLVLKAARLMDIPGATITLDKVLPVASGIGGGSSDAAATLRALARLYGSPLPGADAILSLGADVPVCMAPTLCRMRGIGELVQDLGPAPMLDMLLVNPAVSVATPDVFKGLAKKGNSAMSPDMPDPFDTADWVHWLAAQRNDLEMPAIAVTSVIADVLAALRASEGCQLARMSGSGATCFAIYEDHNARDAAAATISAAHPGWWVMPTEEWSS